MKLNIFYLQFLAKIKCNKTRLVLHIFNQQIQRVLTSAILPQLNSWVSARGLQKSNRVAIFLYLLSATRTHPVAFLRHESFAAGEIFATRRKCAELICRILIETSVCKKAPCSYIYRRQPHLLLRLQLRSLCMYTYTLYIYT